MKTFLREFWLFTINQASACMFGGFLLAMIILTKLWYPFDHILYRNDFLFVAAVLFQVGLLVLKLETFKEALVILIFHLVAMAMEVFKTSDGIGSWNYPGEFQLGIGKVPLFAGFMYSAVGSYIARVWRIFDYRFSNHPPMWMSWVLAISIYVNFFSCHFVYDIRYILLTATFVMYVRTNVFFKIAHLHRHMPVIAAGFLCASFIWIAENVSTLAGIWLYPNQRGEWQMVPLAKLVAWYLLVFVSAGIVSIVHPVIPPDEVTEDKDVR